MTEDAEKRFWAGGLDKISWQVGIEEGIEAGVRAERERIVELLRADQCVLDCPNHPAECYPFIEGTEDYVRLINGEAL